MYVCAHMQAIYEYIGPCNSISGLYIYICWVYSFANLHAYFFLHIYKCMQIYANAYSVDINATPNYKSCPQLCAANLT